MFNPLVDSPRYAATALVFIGVYFLTLAIGRFLKRHGGVRFGVIFQLFCLALAFYAALATYGVRPPWRGHIGSCSSCSARAF